MCFHLADAVAVEVVAADAEVVVVEVAAALEVVEADAVAEEDHG